MEKIDFVNATHPAINDTNLNKMQDNIETAINAQVSGDTLPIAAIIPWSTTIAPNQNWLVCNGQAVSRTTYSQLFNIIGTQYGEGDGSTTFNVPDLRGRHPMGYNLEDTDFNRIGKTGGEKTHTLTKNELPSNIIDTANSGSNTDGYIARAGYTKSESYDFGGGNQPFNVLDPYLTTNYIIKAFQTAGVIAEVVNARNDSRTKVYSTNYINNRLTPISLYHNDSGTSDAVTFSQSLPSDYKYVDIIFTGNNNTTDVTRVYDISKRANLITANCNAQATTIWLQTETIQVTTTGITRGTQAEVAFASGGGVPASSTVLIKDVYAFV